MTQQSIGYINPEAQNNSFYNINSNNSYGNNSTAPYTAMEVSNNKPN